MWWIPAFAAVGWIVLHPPGRVGYPQAFAALAGLVAVVAATAWLSWMFSGWVEMDDSAV